jgi:methylmalonyl-CoA/ethylmalonyl-CoA epimerase
MTLPVFQNLHHVCVVVRDLDRAVAFYESVGVGPWQDFPSLEAFMHDLVVPDDGDFLRLRYKFANLGNVQLQLCEPPVGNTPQRRFLEEQGEGVFHLGFSVPDVDAAEAQGGEHGLATLLHGRKPDGLGFTYFDTRDQGAGVVLQVRSAT